MHGPHQDELSDTKDTPPRPRSIQTGSFSGTRLSASSRNGVCPREMEGSAEESFQLSLVLS
jgi:hypothetical protein